LAQAEIDKVPLVLYIPGAEQEDTLPAASDSEKPESEHLPSTSAPAPSLANTNTTSASPSSTNATKKRKGRRLMSLFRSKQQQKSTSFDQATPGGSEGYVAGPHPYHALPPNRSTCPICLTGKLSFTHIEIPSYLAG